MSLTLQSSQRQYDRQIAAWLILCAGVIFGMILLGGVTRLTESGLSMVEWRPLMGIVPPMNEAQWMEVFNKYRQFPEYQKVNKGMSLADFQYIFMYEYLHRVLGRIIGVLFFFPMIYFALRGRVKAGLMPKLWLLFVLGGCQGLMGWYMVKSGLVDRPDVSQYRLTAHLGLAFLIYAYMLWVIFDLLMPAAQAGSAALARWSKGLVVLIFLMILSGGFVAGTNAGFSYPTWPKMGPSFIPEGLYNTTPFWLAMFEDVTTIQFNHRMFAYLLVILITLFAVNVLRSRLGGRSYLASLLILVALAAQVILGISTLLLHVPIPLAAAHQGGAVVLLSAGLFFAHSLRPVSATH
ncbi:MAG: COX15/CtaA family protein [Halioglobus sp.]